MRKIFAISTILVFLCFSAILNSCVDLKTDNKPIPSSLGLIPSDFDWKTVTEINCSIQVQPVSGISDAAPRTIKIFNSPLLNSSALIASGAAKPGSPYSVSLTLPAAAKTIYIQEILPTGSSTVQSADVTSSSLNFTFTKSGMASFGAPLMVGDDPVPPVNIPSNFDVTLNASSSGTLSGFNSGESSAYGNKYKAYYLPAGVTNSNIKGINGWNNHLVLYVAGKLTLSDFSINQGSLFILDGGIVEIPEFSLSAQTATDIPAIYIAPGGTLSLTSDKKDSQTSGSSYIINRGKITSARNVTFSVSSTFYNVGTIDLSSTKPNFKPTLNFTNKSILYNSGTINTYTLELNSAVTITNTSSGKISVKEYSQSNSNILDNYGEIAAEKTFTISSGPKINNHCHITANAVSFYGTTVNMFSGSLFHCQSLSPNSTTLNMNGGSIFLVDGSVSVVYNLSLNNTTSTFSLFKCLGNFTNGMTSSVGAGTCSVSGNIDFVLVPLVNGSGINGRDRFAPVFSNGALLSNTQTQNIVATVCNLGLGQISGGGSSDHDGDGIPEGTDFDDNDPDVAFVSYFPAEGTWGTIAFEDLWPEKGDYDVNDLVMDFRICTYSNASNLVTKLKIDYNVRASGSTYVLGCAFQLDQVLASQVQSVTGQTLGSGNFFTTASNGAEAAVNLAVIPLFNSQRDLLSYSGYLNTDKNIARINTPDNAVTVKFLEGLSQSKLSVSKINFFITANSRGREIHLPGYTYTTKFLTSLIDGISLYPGDVFKFIDGMMWGLMIPQTFNYPVERAAINNAYTHFAEWATSGGTSFIDWYSLQNGYTNESLIY
jgi:LruC domain-containing protein